MLCTGHWTLYTALVRGVGVGVGSAHGEGEEQEERAGEKEKGGSQNKVFFEIAPQLNVNKILQIICSS